MLLFIVLWFTFSYLPVAHMVWFWAGPGRVHDRRTSADARTRRRATSGRWGALDFAGGTVVHINAGVAGLVGAYRARQAPRLRQGGDDVRTACTMTMIGASLLWFGWFGFNAGSALEANGSAALAFINTYLATACAVLSWMFVEWIVKGKPSMLGAASGAVAGLVAITPAAGNVGIPGAFVIGLAAGVVCLWGVHGLKKMIGADDSLDVFGVHALGGIFGALLTGIFNVAGPRRSGLRAGLGHGHSRLPRHRSAQLWIQAKAVGITIVWTARRRVHRLQDRRSSPSACACRKKRSAKASTSRLTASARTRPSITLQPISCASSAGNLHGLPAFSFGASARASRGVR